MAASISKISGDPLAAFARSNQVLMSPSRICYFFAIQN
jgi:hypothetical protein